MTLEGPADIELSGNYDLEALSYRESLDKVFTRNRRRDVRDETSRTVPEEYVIDPAEGVNADSMEIARAGGDYLLLKPGDANFGRCSPAYLAADMVLQQLDVEHPAIDYDASEDTVLIEHRGRIENIFAALLNGDTTGKEVSRGLAAEAIIGDTDIGGNIGYDQGCIIYDFDRCGAPIRSTEDPIVDMIQRLKTGADADISVDRVEDEIERLSAQLDLEYLEKQFAYIEDMKPGVSDAMSFRPDNILDNIRSGREGYSFEHEMEQTEEPESVKDDDIFRRSLRENLGG